MNRQELAAVDYLVDVIRGRGPSLTNSEYKRATERLVKFLDYVVCKPRLNKSQRNFVQRVIDEAGRAQAIPAEIVVTVHVAPPREVTR
jgi:hypothetical protein